MPRAPLRAHARSLRRKQARRAAAEKDADERPARDAAAACASRSRSQRVDVALLRQLAVQRVRVEIAVRALPHAPGKVHVQRERRRRSVTLAATCRAADQQGAQRLRRDDSVAFFSRRRQAPPRVRVVSPPAGRSGRSRSRRVPRGASRMRPSQLPCRDQRLSRSSALATNAMTQR